MTRTFLALTITAALLTTTACDKVEDTAQQLVSGAPPVVTAVLFDRSTSIDPADREIYLESVRAVSKDIEGGDRIIFAAIGDQTRAAFRPALDIAVEATSVRLDQEDRETQARGALAQKAPALLQSGNNAQHSRIVEAIAAATEAFRLSPKSEHRMILLTDGLENSEVAKLGSDVVTEEQVQEALAKAQKLGLLPDLTGVELSIIGVGGTDFRGVEAFWRAYAAATHADLVRYGRLPYAPPQ